MKKLSLVPILCLVCALSLRAQEQIHERAQPVPKFTGLPEVVPNIGVWPVVKGIQDSHKHQLVMPPQPKLVKGFEAFPAGEITLAGTFAETESGVCSVPLIEARVDVYDPGIATTPRDNSVPIREGHVPAPSCKSNSPSSRAGASITRIIATLR